MREIAGSRSAALRSLRQRSLEVKGHDWRRDGIDYLDTWIRSEQNRRLASALVYVEQRSPGDIAVELAESLSR